VCCSVLQCVSVCSFSERRWRIPILHKPVRAKYVCVAVCCIVVQCVAVCCSALQCVVVCCSVAVCCIRNGASCYAFCQACLRQLRVCCSVSQCVAVCCSVWQCVAVCCSTLQNTRFEKPVCTKYMCVAMRCSALQCVAVHCRIRISKNVQRTATHCNTLQHTATHCNTLQHTATHVAVYCRIRILKNLCGESKSNSFLCLLFSLCLSHIYTRTPARAVHILSRCLSSSVYLLFLFVSISFARAHSLYTISLSLALSFSLSHLCIELFCSAL